LRRWKTSVTKKMSGQPKPVRSRFDPEAFAKLCVQVQYIDGDYRDSATFEQLHAARHHLDDRGAGFVFTEDRRLCLIRQSGPSGRWFEFVISAEGGAPLSAGGLDGDHCVLL